MLPHIHHLIDLQPPGHLMGDEDRRDLALDPVDRLRKELNIYALSLQI